MSFLKKIIICFFPTKWLAFLDSYRLNCLKKISFYDFLILYSKELTNCEISRRAMAISYSLFMSFFPFLIFFFSLTLYLPYNQEIGFHLKDCLFDMLPLDTQGAIKDTLFGMLSSKKPKLFSWSFFLLLFLSTNGIYAFLESFKKMNASFSYKSFSFFRDYLKAFFLTLFLSALLLVALILIYYGQVVYRFFIESQVSRLFLNISTYLMLWIAFFVGILTLYVVGEAQKEGKKSFFLKLKRKLPGAIFATFLFIISSFLFGIYIRNFYKSNFIFGSIRTGLILMLWLYMNNALILSGYKLNSTIELIKKSSPLELSNFLRKD